MSSTLLSFWWILRLCWIWMFFHVLLTLCMPVFQWRGKGSTRFSILWMWWWNWAACWGGAVGRRWSFHLDAVFKFFWLRCWYFHCCGCLCFSIHWSEKIWFFYWDIFVLRFAEYWSKLTWFCFPSKFGLRSWCLRIRQSHGIWDDFWRTFWWFMKFQDHQWKETIFSWVFSKYSKSIYG